MTLAGRARASWLARLPTACTAAIHSALVTAAAYCAAGWLGESLKLAVLATRVLKVAKRFFAVPAFHYYALADGLRVLPSRFPAT